jgi:hypothetical protein
LLLNEGRYEMIDTLAVSLYSKCFVSLGFKVPNKEQHFFQSHSGRAQTGTDMVGKLATKYLEFFYFLR